MSFQSTGRLSAFLVGSIACSIAACTVGSASAASMPLAPAAPTAPQSGPESPFDAAAGASANGGELTADPVGADEVFEALFGLNSDAGDLLVHGFAGETGAFSGSMANASFLATIHAAEPIDLDGIDGVYFVTVELRSGMGFIVTDGLLVANELGSTLLPLATSGGFMLQEPPTQGPGGGTGGGGGAGGGGGGGGPAPCLGTQSNCAAIVGTTCEDVRDRAICMAANAHNIVVCIAIRNYLTAMNAAITTYSSCVTMGWTAADLANDAACLAVYQTAARAAGLALRASVRAAGRAYDLAVQRAWTAYHACQPRTGNNPPSFPIDSVPPAIWNQSATTIPALW